MADARAAAKRSKLRPDKIASVATFFDKLPLALASGRDKNSPGFSRNTMPWIRVWIHFVWSTHDHTPFLTDDIRKTIFQHILENARAKDIFIDMINGYVDHVHCLISLGSNQTLEKVMQLIKGESSFWINKNHLTKTKFAWQDEYFAVSVNPAGLDSVRRYIANQEIHHRNTEFESEFDDFLVRAGFERFKG